MAEHKVSEDALVQFPEEGPNWWQRIHDCWPDDANQEAVRQMETGGVELRARLEQDPGGRRARKKGTPWTKEEHRQFLHGLAKYGRGDWRSISRDCVKTRTSTQIASHAQKYFNRLDKQDKKRSSIHDTTIPQISTTDDVSSAADWPTVQEILAISSSHYIPVTADCSAVPDWPQMPTTSINRHHHTADFPPITSTADYSDIPHWQGPEISTTSTSSHHHTSDFSSIPSAADYLGFPQWHQMSSRLTSSHDIDMPHIADYSTIPQWQWSQMPATSINRHQHTVDFPPIASIADYSDISHWQGPEMPTTSTNSHHHTADFSPIPSTAEDSAFPQWHQMSSVPQSPQVSSTWTAPRTS